jgi:hypothetical protein
VPNVLDENEVEAEGVDARVAFERFSRLLALFARWMRERQQRVALSYLISEDGGYGWYVIGRELAFDFLLNKELAEFSHALIRRGYPIHGTLLPGSVGPNVPKEAIVIGPTGVVGVYAH